MVVHEANGLGLRSSSDIRRSRGRTLIHERNGCGAADEQLQDAHMDGLSWTRHHLDKPD
jgi:hypothetical protein